MPSSDVNKLPTKRLFDTNTHKLRESTKLIEEFHLRGDDLILRVKMVGLSLQKDFQTITNSNKNRALVPGSRIIGKIQTSHTSTNVPSTKYLVFPYTNCINIRREPLCVNCMRMRMRRTLFDKHDTECLAKLACTANLVYGVTIDGGLQDYIRISAPSETLLRIPDNVSLHDAAFSLDIALPLYVWLREGEKRGKKKDDERRNGKNSNPTTDCSSDCIPSDAAISECYNDNSPNNTNNSIIGPKIEPSRKNSITSSGGTSITSTCSVRSAYSATNPLFSTSERLLVILSDLSKEVNDVLIILKHFHIPESSFSIIDWNKYSHLSAQEKTKYESRFTQVLVFCAIPELIAFGASCLYKSGLETTKSRYTLVLFDQFAPKRNLEFPDRTVHQFRLGYKDIVYAEELLDIFAALNNPRKDSVDSRNSESSSRKSIGARKEDDSIEDKLYSWLWYDKDFGLCNEYEQSDDEEDDKVHSVKDLNRLISDNNRLNRVCYTNRTNKPKLNALVF